MQRIDRIPLTQILDEMEASIRGAAEAARRTEEAAGSARQAASLAAKASEQSERLAEETAKAARAAVEEVMARLETEAGESEKLLKLIDVMRVEMEEILESVDSDIELRPEIRDRLKKYIESGGKKTEYRTAEEVAKSLGLEW